MQPLDHAVRLEALDPTRSFLVEAPAGSGKTDLLVKRFLALLGQVEQPHQVLAITFTRKSAQEMKERVMQALRQGGLTEDARVKGWSLERIEADLAIMTIDAFCHSIVSALPLENGFLGVEFIEDEVLLKQDFLALILQVISEGEQGAADFKTLFHYFDNQLSTVQDLLFELLKQRQDWLPIVLTAGQVEDLAALQAASIQALEQDAFAKFNALTPANVREALRESVQGDLRALPAVLLTDKGEWRKRSPHLALIKTLQEVNPSAWEQVLLTLKYLPQYEANAASILPVLLRVLPLSAAYLQVLLKEKRLTDHNEVALQAVSLIEREEAGVAEYLHGQVWHILVDEFQDTSHLQFRLLCALTEHWEPWRTVFLVGDPKQSIYRFRNADVGLFLQAKISGLGAIPLTVLQLQQNFRTDQRLLGVINQHCEALFPKEADAVLNQVPYEASVSAQTLAGYEGVRYYFTSTDEDEAAYLVSEIKRLKETHPEAKLAILVRARTHFKTLMDALQNAEVPFSVKEDLSWVESPILRDLMSLIYALAHLGDRLSWMALLRSPLCGLSKAELLVIAEQSMASTVWSTLTTHLDEFDLSAPTHQRLKRFVAWLAPFIDGPYQVSAPAFKLQVLAEHIWSGPILEQTLLFLSSQARLPPQTEFKRLLTLFAKQTHAGEASASLELLTIHQAKGLEFDYVFLPALHKKVAASDQPILRAEVFYVVGTFHFLLAERKGVGQQMSSMYVYLKWLEETRLYQESLRLFYVALTRAKQGLWLTGLAKPGAKSFLNALQNSGFEIEAHLAAAGEVPTETPKPEGLFRLALEQPLVLPPLPMPTPWIPLDAAATVLETEEQQLGEAVHAYLEARAKGRDFKPSASMPSNRVKSVEKIIHLINKSEVAAWLLAPHEAAEAEWPLVFLNAADQVEKIVIDRTFVEAGVRYIIDYKVSEEAAIVRPEYRAQLLRYQSVIKRMEPQREIKLGLYFPVQDQLVWC